VGAEDLIFYIGAFGMIIIIMTPAIMIETEFKILDVPETHAQYGLFHEGSILDNLGGAQGCVFFTPCTAGAPRRTGYGVAQERKQSYADQDQEKNIS
jgi:hypothetical protein